MKRQNSKQSKSDDRFKPTSRQRRGSKPKTSYSKKVKETGITDEGKAEYSNQEGGNDISFYNKIPDMFRDATQVAFEIGTGRAIDLGTGVGKVYAPGIAAIRLVPVFGRNMTVTAPLNIAATNLFLYLRHTLSGRPPYDAPDVGIYMLGAAQIHSALNFAGRVYASLFSGDPVNKYFPNALVDIQGIDYNDLKLNAADFRFGLEHLILKASKIPVPRGISLVERWTMLYQSIYTEGTSWKDQMYMYVPDGFYKYSQTESGSALTYSPLLSGNTLLTASQFLAYLEDLVDALYLDDDMANIGTNILRAFGSDKLLVAAQMPLIASIAPIFNIGVLEQMHNATIVNANLYENGALSLVQDSETAGYIVNPFNLVATTPATRLALDFIGTNRLLTTTTAEITPELVMESTRLMVALESPVTAGTNQVYAPVYVGTEFCNAVKIAVFTGNATAAIRAQGNGVLSTASTVSAISEYLRYSEAFRFLPERWIGTPGAAYTDQSSLYPLSKFDNYAVVTPEMLAKLHETALLSLLDSNEHIVAWSGR